MDIMANKILNTKSIKEMTLPEKIQLCIDCGYDLDGDVHNGEAFFIIPPNASIELRRKLFEYITGRKIPKLEVMLQDPIIQEMINSMK